MVNFEFWGLSDPCPTPAEFFQSFQREKSLPEWNIRDF